MQNDDNPNRCKVGKTINSPNERAHDLSGGAGTMGTWTPFFVHTTTKSELSKDESAAHQQLSEFAGFHGRAREIFNCSPQKAKELILAGLPRFNESEAKRVQAQAVIDKEWRDGEPKRIAEKAIARAEYEREIAKIQQENKRRSQQAQSEENQAALFVYIQAAAFVGLMLYTFTKL
jgi:hypothetical protein